MEVTLLYFDGCPHWQLAHERLVLALDRAGLLDVDVALRTVDTPDETAALHFLGSPTILIDGRDPFAARKTDYGVACRVYSTPDGVAGSPTVDQLVQAMR